MKKLNLHILVLTFLFLTISCKTQPKPIMYKNMPQETNNQLNFQYSGVIEKRFYKDINNKIDKNKFDYFLVTDEKAYYIKLTESNIKAENLEMMLGAKVKVDVYIRQGAWDVQNEDYLSKPTRFGEYIAIIAFLRS